MLKSGKELEQEVIKARSKSQLSNEARDRMMNKKKEHANKVRRALRNKDAIDAFGGNEIEEELKEPADT